MGIYEIRTLSRPRVVRTLADAIAAYPLVVVTAPMGYGKTTAARAAADHLIQSCRRRVLFVAVPSEPYTAPYLWRLMWGQLADQGLEFARAVREFGFPDDAEQRQQVFAHFRDLPDGALLVIDDYHYVTDPAMHRLLAAFAGEKIPNVTILLLARARPDLPLEVLRLKGSAIVLHQDLLAFTRDETAELFRINNSAANGNSNTLKPDAASQTAWEFCSGWAAALWLSVHNWRRHGVVKALHDVETLLDETIFSSCDSHSQNLLIRLSLLEDFSPEEAAFVGAVPGDAARIRELHAQNVFLGLDPVTGRYRLHDLFRSFLAKRLETSLPDKTELHRRAAECCRRRGDLIQALRLSLKAGGDADSLRVLELFSLPGGSLLLSFFKDEVVTAVTAIPWPIRQQRYMEYLAFLYFYLAEAGDPAAIPLLDEADARFAEADLPESLKRRLHGEIVFIRSLLHFNDAEAMCESFAEAHRLLHGRSQVARPNMTWAFGSPHAGYLFLRRPGTYRELVERMEKHLHTYQELTDGCGAGAQALFRAEWHLERGEFGEAKPFSCMPRAWAVSRIPPGRLNCFCKPARPRMSWPNTTWRWSTTSEEGPIATTAPVPPGQPRQPDRATWWRNAYWGSSISWDTA